LIRVLLLALGVAACQPSSAQAPISEQWRNVSIEATPVALGAERVGALVFRGGLSLRSEDYAFGGFSGLEVLDDGRIVAITDNGDWFSGRLRLSADGALEGVDEGRMALMRDEHAEPFPNKAAGDSEGLAQLLDGRFAVSFEQTQTIRIYDLNRDGPFGAAAPGPALSETQQLPSNQGLEALAVAGDGALIVGAEGGSGGGATLWRAPLDASTPAPPAARYPLDLGFALTSLDHLPDGGFVALERFYAPVIGARTRITMFGEDVFGGGAVAPRELAALRPPLEIDNFEAVSAVRMPGNITRLYILSDNNFSERQRTLLYAFDIVGEGG
jgi:hypothetical protein